MPAAAPAGAAAPWDHAPPAATATKTSNAAIDSTTRTRARPAVRVMPR